MSGISTGDLEVPLKQECGFPSVKIRFQDRALDWIDLNHDDIDSFIDMIKLKEKIYFE